MSSLGEQSGNVPLQIHDVTKDRDHSPSDINRQLLTPQSQHSQRTLTASPVDQRPRADGVAQGAASIMQDHDAAQSVTSLGLGICYPIAAEAYHDITSYEGGFSNAHDFIVNTVNMYNISRTNDTKRAEEEKQAQAALEKLASKAMPSAMLNSKEREEAPRCNEDTRVTLRGLAVEWGQNREELQRLLWLFGPAAVGKSAVAQTVAEELKEEGYLGAAFFFSRPNNRSDPNVVIPTIVYQLALLLPPYRLIIAQRLIEDPLILTESRRSQFKAFVTGPFLTALSQRPLTFLHNQLLNEITDRPLCIILDGLDECESRDAQCEFAEIISQHAQDDTDSRLRWMIFSRPESHLEVAFSNASCKATCRLEKLEIDNEEARQDAERILNRGFSQIRDKYPNQLNRDWPSQSQIRFIAHRASGHLGFVSFAIRFIGDNYYDDPSRRLDVCIRFLEGIHRPEDLNPLHALDLLYTQILSDIPQDILPVTQRILGLFILYDNTQLTALVLANFLGLDQVTLYRSLQRLYSVLFVPPAPSAEVTSIEIYHTSFSDYLRDPARAKKFVLNEGEVHLDVATRGLEWLKYWRKNPSVGEAPQELTWVPKSSDKQTLLDTLCEYSFEHCWTAFPKVPGGSLPTLKWALRKFDFDLDYSKWKGGMRDFVCFLRWLLSSDAKTLMRVDRWRAGLGISLEAREVAVPWYEDDPQAFVTPFLQARDCADYYSIHLRLMTHKPTALCLIIEHNRFRQWYPNIEFINQLQKDDIIIAFMNSPASEKNTFTRLLTGRTAPLSARKPEPWATRINHHPKYGNKLVLVEIPWFGDTGRTDVEILMLMNEWLENTYRRGIKLGGIIYFHPITDAGMTGASHRSLRMLGSICGDKAACRMALVLTMWERDHPASQEAREAGLKDEFWKSFINKGSSIERLRSNKKKEIWRILEKLADTTQHRELLLLQEEAVDLQRSLNETEAGKMLRSYLPILLNEQMSQIRSLLNQIERSNSAQEQVELEEECRGIQDQFERLSKDAKRFELSIGRRAKSLLSLKKPRSRPIVIPDLQC